MDNHKKNIMKKVLGLKAIIINIKGNVSHQKLINIQNKYGTEVINHNQINCD